MTPLPRDCTGRHDQHGFALVTGLIMLVLVSLIGLAASRGIRQETVMANNTRERDLAFQAAEAALAEAESKLQSVYHPYVTATTRDCSVAGLIYRLDPDSDGCPVGSNGNGCPSPISATNTITECQIKATTAKYWTDTAPNGYGWFDSNGAVDASKSIVAAQTIVGVDQQARYVVEYLGTVTGTSSCMPTPAHRYRFTALAVGASTATRKVADTRVMLQSEVMLCIP